MDDFLIIGAGMFGAVCARQLMDAGMRVRVIEKRDHIGGNVFTEEIDGIQVHRYGAHIFHTNDKDVWEYIGRFGEFNRFTNSPIANYKGKIFSLPFNMYTFNRMWGVVTPQEAMEKIAEQRDAAGITEPKNLEEQAISLVGTEIYEKLIKGYTEKQWGRSCEDLPSFIIQRLPVRYKYDNNYFNARFQGIPVHGYTEIIENMLAGAEICLGVDYLADRKAWRAEKMIYTGAIDEYFGYCYGPLEYRSIRFDTEVLDMPDYQGNAVVNYTDREIPWTRIIEHKHFSFGNQKKTVISREYSDEWEPGKEPFYPINDRRNTERYKKYADLAGNESGVFFGGRLGTYQYMDMDTTIRKALDLSAALIAQEDMHGGQRENPGVFENHKRENGLRLPCRSKRLP